jgi:hypothetical protein
MKKQVKNSLMRGQDHTHLFIFHQSTLGKLPSGYGKVVNGFNGIRKKVQKETLAVKGRVHSTINN